MLNDVNSFRAWINRIAVNKSINFLKRMNKISLQQSPDLQQMMDVMDFEVSFENTVIESDVKTTLDAIMSRLPEEQHTAMFLFYYQGMTVKEIAKLYGCPESTIKSRLTYARKFMRKEIERFENEGYKLRCMTALPFIPYLFRLQRAEVSAAPPALNFNAPNSSASGSAYQNTTSTGSGSPTGISGTAAAAGKEKAMTKTAKIVLISIISAVIVGGSVLGVVLATKNNSGSIPVESASSQLSEISTEESENSEEESKEESSADESSESVASSKEESSKAESSKEEFAPLKDWKFKENVKQPTFKDSTYETVELFDGKTKVTTATPAYTVDYEKAAKAIKENEVLRTKYGFAEGEKEIREFQDYSNLGDENTNQQKHTYSQMYMAYDKSAEEKASWYSSSKNNVHVEVTRTYSRFNAPDECYLHFTKTELTQEEMYPIVKEVFGEEIAEYLVYQDGDDDEKKILPTEPVSPSKHLTEKESIACFVNYTVTVNATM